MKSKTVSTALLALVGGISLLVGSTSASAGSWSKTRTGRNGGTVSHSGSCAAGAGCTRSASATGPNGRTWTSTHSAQANGRGGLDRSATYTGPRGTISRSVDTYRYP